MHFLCLPKKKAAECTEPCGLRQELFPEVFSPHAPQRRRWTMKHGVLPFRIIPSRNHWSHRLLPDSGQVR